MIDKSTVIMALFALTMGISAFAGVPDHPNHLSLAEVEYNKKTRELEVSLAVLAIDFEESLSRLAGKRVNLDRTKNIEKIIENYLAERFTVTLADGRKPKPQFLGREDKGKVVWIYFTMPFPANAALTTKKHTAARFPEKGEFTTISATLTLPKSESPVSPLVNARLENRVLMELNEGQCNRVIIREGTWRKNMFFESNTQKQILRETPSVEREKAEQMKARSKRQQNAKRKKAHRRHRRATTQTR